MIQTESECGNGSNDWNAAEYTWGLMNHYLKNGANAYTYWNMILDETGSSMWGWVQNSLISINKNTGEVKYNPEYYIMKHLSHYVQPGAYRVETNGGDDHLAFINPDGKIIVVIVNKENNNKSVNLNVKNQVYSVELEAHSFNTFSF